LTIVISKTLEIIAVIISICQTCVFFAGKYGEKWKESMFYLWWYK